MNEPISVEERQRNANSIVTENVRQQRLGAGVSDDDLIAANLALADEIRSELAKQGFVAAAIDAAGVSTHGLGREQTALVKCPSCKAALNQSQVRRSGRTSESMCGNCGQQLLIVHELALERVAHFDLTERIGSGGFGTVWRAVDTQLDREVAIKVANRGNTKDAAAEESLTREARAAAQLNHPHIVATHEVGNDGENAYIVSELIDGDSLKVYMAAAPFTANAAATMMILIADAVQYAHGEGVIHRDLKPQNILIDEDNVPHIADFGLARRDTSELTVTLDGQVVGTPAYMSPEQARGDSHQSDRRSDVYSLGVILFELLTRELPFRGSLPALVRQVVESEPPRPRTLQPRVPRDLETICIKCLQKSPDHRYQTAAQLSNDLKRFVAKEPISARRASPIQRSIRWCQRRPAIAALLSLLAATIISGFVASRRQTVRAVAAGAVAEQSAARSQRMLDFVMDSFRSPDPKNVGREVRVVDVLERVVDDAESELSDDPVQTAAILDAVGETLRSLGIYDVAIRAHERALELNQAELGDRHPDTLWSMNYLALCYKQSGEVRRAIPMYENTLNSRRTVLGPQHEDTLMSLLNLATAYTANGESEKSAQLLEQCRSLMEEHLGDNHQLTLAAMNNLTGAYDALGRRDESVELNRVVVARREDIFGSQDSETLIAKNNLAQSLARLKKYSEAMTILEPTIESAREVLGPNHPMTLTMMNNFVVCLSETGRFKRAGELADECAQIASNSFGESHVGTLQLMASQAGLLRINRRVEEALEVAERGLALSREHRGEEHPTQSS